MAIYIYPLLFILCSLNLSAQTTLLNENFTGDASTIPTIPAGDYYWVDYGPCDSDWEITKGIGNGNCKSCSGERAGISYGSSSGCSVDAILVVGPFTPSGTCVDISFDYGYNTSRRTSGDDFFVRLYDNSGSLVTNLVSLTTSDAHGNYSQQICGLIAGKNYNIVTRFRDTYNAWGAEVDNFLVTESCTNPSAAYTTVADCGNPQFYIEVNVSVDGSSYAGCALASSVLTSSCVISRSQDFSSGTSICNNVVFSGKSNGPRPKDDIEETNSDCLCINKNESSLYFIDDNINDGVLYYRLRQVDSDGFYTDANTIAVKQSDNTEISFFPNPTKGNVKLNIVSKNAEEITITISSLFHQIHEQRITLTRENHVLDIDIFKGLDPGFYVIKAVDANGNLIKTEKIIKN